MPKTIDRQGVMEHIKTCGYAECGYTTNIKGDMTRHHRAYHVHKASQKTPNKMYVKCIKCERVIHVLNDGYGASAPCSVCRPQISYV